MTRYQLRGKRYATHDGGWWHIYDSPGYILDGAADGDVEGLERLMALIAKLGGST